MPNSQALRRFWPLLILVLCVAAVLGWWLTADSKPASSPMGRGGPWDGPIPVRLSTVSQGDFAVELKALGSVTALNTAQVRSRVDGELIAIDFAEGQQVKAGDVLAQIDPRSYQIALQQAEGVLAQNMAQLKSAEVDLKRYQGLYADDSIAKQTLDNQQALVEQYRGTIKNNQAAVAEARLNLDYTRIRAPISGRLGLRQIDLGNLVRSGEATPLVTITQVEPIVVAFTLPEQDLPAVLSRAQRGEQLVVEAWDRSEQHLLASGKLESMDNQIDLATGTLKLKALFSNADERLFPNQFVNVRLRVENRENALLIPSAAVQFGTRGTFVYVLNDAHQVHIRDVKIAASEGAISMIEQGLVAGEQVVLEGTDKLKEGSRVQVIDDSGQVQAPANAAAQKQSHP